MNDDLISIQAANYKICNACGIIDCDQMDKCKKLFTAQPETHEERTETHGVCLDTISRQAAIDAHYEYCNNHPDASFPVWSLKILEALPSAQPELPEWAQRVEEYRKSAPSFVRNQLVWALYQTWKGYDR